MGHAWQDVAAFALRTLGVGVLVFLMSKYLPRRSGGGLAAYDFVFFWMMGGMAVAPLYDLKIQFMATIAAIATVYLCHYGLAGLALRNEAWATWLVGKPIVVIDRGTVREGQVERGLLPVEMLLSELRVAGAPRVSEVETAILETTGHLSLVKKAGHLPVTTGDLGKTPADQPLPVALVADGKINTYNIRKLGVSEDWLRSQLRKAGAPEPAHLFAAIWEGTEPIYWAAKADYHGKARVPAWRL